MDTSSNSPLKPVAEKHFVLQISDKWPLLILHNLHHPELNTDGQKINQNIV